MGWGRSEILALRPAEFQHYLKILTAEKKD